MKVKDLIEELKKFDQEQEVYVSASDGDDITYEEACSVVNEAFINSDGMVFVLEYYEPEDGEDTSNRVVLIS